jgi:biotin synthase
VISTREYQDRLDTLGRVRDAGLKVCCGGIVGMGETRCSAPA